MHLSLLLTLALVVFSTASLYGHKNILLSDDGSKIVVVNEDGKSVIIQTDKVGFHGNQFIEIQITHPTRVTKTVQISDKIVDIDGTLQSTLLKKIFSLYQGTIDKHTYSVLLDTIAKQVLIGKVNQNVVFALRVLNVENDIFDYDTIDKVFQEEELKDLVEEQLWKEAVLGDKTFGRQLQINQLQTIDTHLENRFWRNFNQQFKGVNDILKEEHLKNAIFGNKNVLVNWDGSKIVVVNENGKSVQIHTRKVDLLGNRMIEIYITRPNRFTKTIRFHDKIVDLDGTFQSTVLAKIFSLYQGTINHVTFNDLLNTLVNKVSVGKVDSNVVFALKTLKNEDDILMQNVLTDIQGQQADLLLEKLPFNRILENAVEKELLKKDFINREIELQAIDKAMSQENQKVKFLNELDTVETRFGVQDRLMRDVKNQEQMSRILYQPTQIHLGQDDVRGLDNLMTRQNTYLYGMPRKSMLNKIVFGLPVEQELQEIRTKKFGFDDLLDNQIVLNNQLRYKQDFGGVMIPRLHNTWTADRVNLYKPRQWWNLERLY